MSLTMQQTYTPDELQHLRKADLTELIRKQPDQWPSKPFNPSKVKIGEMRSALLNPANGFHKPVAQVQHPRQGSPCQTAHPHPPTPCSIDNPSQSKPPTPLDVVMQVPQATLPPPFGIQGSLQVPSASLQSTTLLPTRQFLEVEASPCISPRGLFAGSMQPETIHKANAGEILGIDGSVGPESLSLIQLFIADHRPAYRYAEKIAVDICVPQSNIQHLDHHTSSVLVAAVVNELQVSHAALKGPMRLGCPHPLDPDYIQFFATCPGDQRLQDVFFSPETIRLSENSVLRIHAHEFNTTSGTREITSGCTPQPANGTGEGSSTQNMAPVHFPPARTFQHESPDISWLHEKAQIQSGFSLMDQARHRRLQNSDIVLVWKFVADFYDVYFGAKGRSGKRVTKKAIFKSLCVGETWFNDALAGHRLVKIYGPGGIHSSPEVVAELQTTRQKHSGQSALLEFLREWESEHPCT